MSGVGRDEEVLSESADHYRHSVGLNPGSPWVTDAEGHQVMRVLRGGEVTHRIPTPMPTFACALGGADGRTLFILCAAGTHEADVAGTGSGAIFTLEVDAPHAGLP